MKKPGMLVKKPDRPARSYRVTLTIEIPRQRIDQVLMAELRKQNENLTLKNISRTTFKELFKKKKILIKGQSTVPSSLLAKGTTYVDILDY